MRLTCEMQKKAVVVGWERDMADRGSMLWIVEDLNERRKDGSRDVPRATRRTVPIDPVIQDPKPCSVSKTRATATPSMTQPPSPDPTTGHLRALYLRPYNAPPSAPESRTRPWPSRQRQRQRHHDIHGASGTIPNTCMIGRGSASSNPSASDGLWPGEVWHEEGPGETQRNTCLGRGVRGTGVYLSDGRWMEKMAGMHGVEMGGSGRWDGGGTNFIPGGLYDARAPMAAEREQG